MNAPERHHDDLVRRGRAPRATPPASPRRDASSRRDRDGRIAITGRTPRFAATVIVNEPSALRYCSDALLAAAAAASAQENWREYPSIERGWYGRDSPADQAPGEFVVGRLMFPQTRTGYMLGAGPGDWRRGGTAWTVDYPEGDRT